MKKPHAGRYQKFGAIPFSRFGFNNEHALIDCVICLSSLYVYPVMNDEGGESKIFTATAPAIKCRNSRRKVDRKDKFSAASIKQIWIWWRRCRTRRQSKRGPGRKKWRISAVSKLKKRKWPKEDRQRKRGMCSGKWTKWELKMGRNRRNSRRTEEEAKAKQTITE